MACESRPSVVRPRETNRGRFEQKLTRSEYEQLVRTIAVQRRRLLHDMRKTNSSVLDVLVDPSRIRHETLLQAIEDGAVEDDERGVVQLLQSVT